MEAIRRFFKLDERGTTVATEVRAGVVTFMTMAYIIVVQPIVLMSAGMPLKAVMLATCLSSAFATALMGLLANYPIALAPAMGHNFYFTLLVVSGAVPNWQTALGANFISGALFLALSFVGFRERIIRAVPDSLKYAIAVGIGLLIALVGFQTAGFIAENADNPIATGLRLGPLGKPAVLAAIGLAITGGLMAFRVRGAILIGLLATTIVGIAMGLVRPAATLVSRPPWGELKETFLALDVAGACRMGLLGVVFTFFFLDLFDTIGTLIGVSQQAGFMVNGELPRARQALFSDAAGTVAGTLLGTSTVTSYIESSAGVSEGGRTGLANLVTAALFLGAMFFSPCVEMIAGGVPTTQEMHLKHVQASWQTKQELAGKTVQHETEAQGPAGATLVVRRLKVLSPVTAPTLILIGCLIMSAVAHIPWSDWTEALPAFLAMLMMPLTGNITEGIAFGFIAYAFLKLLTGRGRQVSPWLLAFAALFVVRYVYMAFYGVS
ncbi:MAG TPA: NCS2 family permease [Planctomycetota bacterium]|nr:NCS2 family permease [Planctomycetota bacterium]